VSGRRDREARREERLRAEEKAGAAERRQLLIKVGSAAAFLVLVAVAVAVVVSQSGSGGGDASNVKDVSEVKQLLTGIPQRNLVLGEPSAKVTVVEFGDLQCPICKAFSEEAIPSLIEGRVRSGEAALEFSNLTILGPQSIPAGAAAIAAGRQGRGWEFVELFYRNQGAEGSGYVTDEFLTAVAEGAGVPDIARWNRDRKSKAVLREVEETTAEAHELGFTGTPSFAVEGPGTEGLEPVGAAPSLDAIEEATSNAR
jgi:protein-disulfide isomerase